jgi:hypothetical protein
MIKPFTLDRLAGCVRCSTTDESSESLSAHDAIFVGTFLPFFRALDRPTAIACLRLFTLPPRPLLAVPRLWRRISLLTSLLALREYLRRLFAMRLS